MEHNAMTASSNKYSANDPAFDAEHGVLRNMLGLTSEAALLHAESEALIAAYEEAALGYSELHTFTADDVCRLHKLFLGGIFEWAGMYRTIDISSPGIRWCHAQYIDQEMARFDTLLRAATPLSPNLPHDEIITKVAEIHGEFIAIHPFRDGNGRTGRMLANLMLMQAECPPFRMVLFDTAEMQEKYFAAIRDVWANVDYTKLTRLFAELVPKP
ncbi:MAG: Fic family protein [Alphaproteobacteria bacterium]|nr:Fic family protein [Alphaproteobacteria bacterium]